MDVGVCALRTLTENGGIHIILTTIWLYTFHAILIKYILIQVSLELFVDKFPESALIITINGYDFITNKLKNNICS